jgi:hypothetical protein
MAMPTIPTQRGAMTKATQKLPVSSIRYQANTAPSIYRAPWAILMICRSPKIMFNPRAMRAIINPQTIPFKMATAKLEITNLVLIIRTEFQLKPLPFFL